MALDSSWGNDHFHRNEIFNTMLKKVLRDDLFAENWVNYVADFTDGSNYKINSVGELTMDQKAEGVSLPDRRPDSGQFLFNINEFPGVKTSWTKVFLEDDFMAPQVLATLPDRMTRAMDEYMETRVLRLHRRQLDTSVNGSDSRNFINGAQHRFVANGTGRAITLNDIAYVNYALKKANVNRGAMIGIVDPSFEFNINVSGQVQTTDNPMYRGIIESGIGQGFRFVRNIYGIDFYTSNYLDTEDSADSNMDDYAGNNTASVAGDLVNQFFSVSDRETLPFIGAWRRRPVINSWSDPDKETEYHELSARFGLALYRPENLVSLISSSTLS